VNEAKKYFEKFVEKYNAGELPSKIYKGIAFRYVQAREGEPAPRAIAKERGELAHTRTHTHTHTNTQTHTHTNTHT